MVPIVMMRQFGLKEKDMLDWEINFIEGKKVVIVSKDEEE